MTIRVVRTQEEIDKIKVLQDDNIIQVFYHGTTDNPMIKLLEQMAAAEEVIFDLVPIDSQHKSSLTIHREKMGLTGEQLADMVGCARQTLSYIENKKTTPRLDLAVRIADMVKMDVRELL